MPTFTFKCYDCKEVFDEEMDRKEQRTPECPNCDSKNVRKVFEATPVIYNADGFTKRVDK